MNTTYELNNLRKDSDYVDSRHGQLRAGSVVSEVFSAMVDGKELSAIKGADKAVNYIKELGSRASNGDPVAVAELNTLRRFYVEAPLLQEVKLLSVFGTYQNVGYDETIEREVYDHVGEKSRAQANAGDVVFPMINKQIYQVPTFTVSGGFAVDYRRVELGDMTKENEGMEQVRIDIRNKAALAVVNKVRNAIINATGVKFINQEAGLTKTNTDAAISKVRRFGKTTILGDYALLQEFTPWAGYVGTVNSNTITGISEAQMNQIAETGLLGMYNGSVLAEIPNPYNVTELNAAGDNFTTLLPMGLGFIIPTGVNSPIATWTRGGLTSFTGNNVKNGKVETRFDLEVAVDVAKGHEYEIGLIYDSNLG